MFEALLHFQRSWKFNLLMAALTISSFLLILYYPFLICVLLGIAYLYNHYHFLMEEKIYASIVIFLYAFLTWLSYADISICIVAAWITVILEYISLRIMKREEDKTVIYQNKLMKQQIDEIENINMTMRGWRHDYHNHLQSLKGYLKLKQYNEMKNYLKDLETDLDEIDTLYHTGNIQADAILNAKLAIAEKNGIHVKCNAVLPPVLHVNEIDLCVIIGNLLDNAIESCRKIEDPDDRFIRVYLGILKKQLYISITNSTGESVKIRTDAYFSAKRGDHGHGLKRIDQTVKKYDGYLNRQNEPGVFATEILLPL
jgi:sensor histidine kinase YesM